MSVLLSIKPKYVTALRNGTKLFEFRKSIFKKQTNEIWIYESSPVKLIVGKIYINEIIEASPNKLWSICNKNAGIDKVAFFEYFQGRDKGYAIAIEKCVFFDKPIDPYLVRAAFKPPQSYAYIDKVLPTLIV